MLFKKMLIMKKIFSLFFFIFFSSIAAASPKKNLYLKCIEISDKSEKQIFDGPVGVFVGRDILKLENDNPLKICKETEITIEAANDCSERKIYTTLNLVSLKMILIVDLWSVSRSELKCEIVKNPRD